jgi:tetratricopeptide (TPR) repeat protein
VNKDLYYAPVFFINGNIKGTDLFYRHTTKSFVPATESWVEYLISLSETSEGKGVPISERINTRRQMNLQAIVSPPDTMMARKYASAAWEEMKEKAASLTALPTDSILRKFITQHGGFGAIKKIASAATNDPDFANALFTMSEPDNYMPALDPYKPSAPSTSLLTLHQNLMKNANVKSASAADLNKGYLFEDSRPKEAMNDLVYEANEREMQSVTQPGIYNVLVADGSTRRMICSYHRDLLSAKKQLNPSDDADEFGGSYTGKGYETTNRGGGLHPILPFVAIDTDDHKSRFIDLLPTTRAWRVLGHYEKEIDPSEVGSATPEANKMYRVYNAKTKTISDAWYVTKVTDKELGLKDVELVKHCTDGTPTVITLNPDYDGYDPIEKVYGKHCVWIPIKFEKEKRAPHSEEDHYCVNPDESIEFGDLHAINNFIYKQGFVKGAVEKIKDEIFVRLRADKLNTPASKMSKLAATAALMTHCALSEADADEIIKQACTRQDRRYLFFYQPADTLKQLFTSWRTTPNGSARSDLEFKMIKLAATMNPKPEIPEEARGHFIKAETLFKAASDSSDYELAANEYLEAFKLAPWWPNVSYNLAVVREAEKQYDKAINDLNLYLASNPDDARDAQDKLYQIQAERDLADKHAADDKAKEQEEAAKAQEPRFTGKWYYAPGDDYFIEIFGSSGTFSAKLPKERYVQTVENGGGMTATTTQSLSDLKIQERRITFRETITVIGSDGTRFPTSYQDYDLMLSDDGKTLSGTALDRTDVDSYQSTRNVELFRRD